MTEQEHYSLRWNNHQNHILRAFDALLQTKTLVDVTLVCAETSIRAHKVVLSACSPFFQNVFAENPCKHPVIVLKDYPGWVVQAIVDFMYRGEISVPQERLQTLIQAGESLQIRGLVDHSITENVSLPSHSPDEFIDSSALSSDTQQQTNYDESTSIVQSSANSVKHHPQLLRPHSFSERERERTVHQSLENRESCTSPMPRRKQARPRRRSGECGPHDLTSKPTTPTPPLPNAVNERNFLNKDIEREKETEGIDMVRDLITKNNKKLINSTATERFQRKIENMENEDEEEDDETAEIDENQRDLDAMNSIENDEDEDNDDNDDNDENDNDDIEPEDDLDQMDDSDSRDGPENLCIKNSVNNTAPASTAGLLVSRDFI